MTYAYDLENGQRLIVQNDGDDTLVALRSDDEGQQQSQSTGFDTGRWLKPPELFRTGGKLVLRLESKGGVDFIRVRGNQVQLMRSEPELENAERLKLKKSSRKRSHETDGADGANGANEADGTDEADGAHATNGNEDGRHAHEHGLTRKRG